MGLRKQFINNLVFQTFPCAAGFNNNNNYVSVSFLSSFVICSYFVFRRRSSDAPVNLQRPCVHGNDVQVGLRDRNWSATEAVASFAFPNTLSSLLILNDVLKNLNVY